MLCRSNLAHCMDNLPMAYVEIVQLNSIPWPKGADVHGYNMQITPPTRGQIQVKSTQLYIYLTA